MSMDSPDLLFPGSAGGPPLGTMTPPPQVSEGEREKQLCRGGEHPPYNHGGHDVHGGEHPPL